MSGLMGLLLTGKRTLVAQQFAQSVVGNNIANVNTEGYSRQRIKLTPAGSMDTPWGKVGIGVQVDSIVRNRDAYVDKIYRRSQGLQSEWQTRDLFLQQIDAVFSESDESGIGSMMDAFFNSWQDLANSPESTQARIAVREKGVALTNSIQTAAKSIKEQRIDADKKVVNTVSQINDLIGKIAELNSNVPTSDAGNGQSNELLDQRDRLIDALSALVDVNVIDKGLNGVGIYIGSMNVVEVAHAEPIKMAMTVDGGVPVTRVIGANGADLPLYSGQLKALVDLRDETLPKYLDSLNTLSKTLVEQTNSYHKIGYTLDGETGFNFFDNRYIDAENIRLSDTIVDDPTKIIAAASDTDGDNTQALRIAGLKNAPLLDGSSMRDYYAGIITQVGTDAASTADSSQNYEIIATQATLQKEAVSGVSLDEEMAEMIRYEQSYKAAAKLIATVDSMIETIISLK